MPALTSISSQIILMILLSFIMLSKVRAQELRILTWTGYAPDSVIELFEKETGIKVKVTLTNNADIIDQLRENRGAGYDLVQPSMDQIAWSQQQYQIYKPIDMNRIDLSRVDPSLLKVTSNNVELEGSLYGLPHVWGTNGLIAHTSKPGTSLSFKDLCSSEYQGKAAMRLDRPTLIGFAFALGEDPFSAYDNQSQYRKILTRVSDKLIRCKNNLKAYWQGGESLLNQFRKGELRLATGWDAGGWKLHQETGHFNYVAPESGALGWIDTFALPARSKNDKAAYQWINFVMKPEIAALITKASGQFTASAGSEEYVDHKLAKSYRSSFSLDALKNIKWFPAQPEGISDLEQQALNQIRTAL
ncbi:extracellular solute-binding protein [Endozoicomonas numazuensis]|uniref:Spermidine/putrescine ABC transporter substrate-binding protein n=1 Tax=Endozoicomonas numazuensis TaxID=1137799 RepID=A0A081NCL5_9GAMM|nr:extracellular solute-binding protein [Endozoicomonas numazuensis]KEQ16188.1 spermidine/putrescine ABC transporter substrate-binding protein [Endozoicomonas numazuensis]